MLSAVALIVFVEKKRRAEKIQAESDLTEYLLA